MFITTTTTTVGHLYTIMSSSEPLEHTKQVQAIQELLQDTGGASDDSDALTSSGDEKEHEENGVAPIIPTAVCSGDGGCGETFSFDARGSDFEFAMLCATCYKKLDQQQSSTIRDEVTDITAVDTNDAGSDDEVVEVIVDGKHCDNSDDDEDVSSTAEDDTGRVMAVILQAARNVDREGRYDVEVGGNTNVYQAYINDQDNITGKTKKFWKLVPDPTELLYGFLHYHALLDTKHNRAWLGHCRLSTGKLGADGDGYVLWEIWETRCNDPRIDGIIIKENGDVIRLKDVVHWLKKNKLNSDVEREFDEDFYQK